MHRAIRQKNDYITEEVLATSLDDNLQSGDHEKTWDINGEIIQVQIQKVSLK